MALDAPPAPKANKRRLVGKQPVPPITITDDEGDESDEGGEAIEHRAVDPWSCAQEIYGIRSRELMRLIQQRAPPILFELLLTLTACAVLPIRQDLLVDAIEYFAGVAEIQKAVQTCGMKCLAFDKDYDDEGMDLLSDLGFVTAFIWALRLKRYGLTPWGTLCSSWIWVSRSVT